MIGAVPPGSGWPRPVPTAHAIGRTDTQFVLTPVWNNPNSNAPSFTGQYYVSVSGNAQGYNTIYVEGSSINVAIYLNGVTATFDPFSISVVNVTTNGSSNRINVYSLPRNVTLNANTNGTQTVYVSDGGSLAAIQGTVNVANSSSSGQTTLIVDDYHDDLTTNISINSQSVYFSNSVTSATINYGSSVTALDIWDGIGTNLIDVQSAPAVPTILYRDGQDTVSGPGAGSITLD